MLSVSDFWPPLQGGPEQLEGVFVDVAHVVEEWGEPPDHPEIVRALDECDVQHFLEGVAEEVGVAEPDRVVWFCEELVRPRSVAVGIPPGWYAYWPCIGLEVPTFPKSAVVGPVKISYRYPRFVPAGADVVIWLLAFLAIGATAGWLWCK